SIALLERGESLAHGDLVRLQENLTQLNLLTNIMTRTRRRDVYPNAAKREAQVIAVALTDAERMVYDELSDYCFRQYQIWKGDFAARFALITFQRQLASSIFATVKHYRESIPAIEWDDAVEFGTDEPEAGWEMDDGLQAGGWLHSQPEFRQLIQSAAARLSGSPDGKHEQFLRILDEQHKVVVFSYFKKS